MVKKTKREREVSVYRTTFEMEISRILSRPDLRLTGLSDLGNRDQIAKHVV